MDTFRKKINTIPGQSFAVVVDAILVYIFGSISVDTANMFAYAAMVFFLIAMLSHLVRLVQLSWKGLAHGRRAKG